MIIVGDVGCGGVVGGGGVGLIIVGDVGWGAVVFGLRRYVTVGVLYRFARTDD